MATERDDELLDDAEAAAELEVTVDRIDAMVDQELLTPVDGPDGARRVRRAAVIALREVGG